MDYAMKAITAAIEVEKRMLSGDFDTLAEIREGQRLSNLRDQFAMAAAQGDLASMIPQADDAEWSNGISAFLDDTQVLEYATHWYWIADAMLLARSASVGVK